MTDWFSSLTAWQFLERANVTLQKGAAPPAGDTILINGTNKNTNGGGKYSRVTLTPGKKHLLRLINTSVEASLQASLDGHNFTVIAADFVPVEPFTTNQLTMTIGQRYDVIITASQAPSNYWFRVQAASGCASAVNNGGKAIFSYSGVTVADPTSTGVSFDSGCNEPGPLVPKWHTCVPSADFESQVKTMNVDLAIPNVTTNNQNVVSWTVDLTTITVNWEDPTLQYVIDRKTDYPSSYNLIEIPEEGTVRGNLLSKSGMSNIQK